MVSPKSSYKPGSEGLQETSPVWNWEFFPHGVIFIRIDFLEIRLKEAQPEEQDQEDERMVLWKTRGLTEENLLFCSSLSSKGTNPNAVPSAPPAPQNVGSARRSGWAKMNGWRSYGFPHVFV